MKAFGRYGVALFGTLRQVTMWYFLAGLVLVLCGVRGIQLVAGGFLIAATLQLFIIEPLQWIGLKRKKEELEAERAELAAKLDASEKESTRRWEFIAAFSDIAVVHNVLRRAATEYQQDLAVSRASTSGSPDDAKTLNSVRAIKEHLLRAQNNLEQARRAEQRFEALRDLAKRQFNEATLPTLEAFVEKL